MFGSRLTAEKLTEDVSYSSSHKTRKDDTHVLENLPNFEQEDEKVSSFMEVFEELTSIGGLTI